MDGYGRDSLGDIREKVEAGRRLDREDGVRLYQSNDLLAIGEMADLVRRRKAGDQVYFITNRHINHTNVCQNLCKLCAFAKRKGEPGAYTMNLEEIEARAAASRELGATEVHIVGGLDPDLPFEYYEEMLRRVSGQLPGVHIQAFTAVEIDFFAGVTGLSPEAVLRRLQEAGLGSLPGGGAEIFSPRVRRRICEKKISGDRWLQVHEAAHRIGMRTNATMLYGHIETAGERVDHLIGLRQLQDHTEGFQAFIPLAFHPENTALGEETPLAPTTGFDDLKTLAISRLMLDNFDHIKAFWIMIGTKLAQISLSFGVDDLDGTVVEERITHAAGAKTAEYTRRDELVRLIREAGRIPVERDTLYNVIQADF